MTETPFLPSPPGLPQLPSNATSTPTPPEEAGDSEIQCICDYTDDDGYTICCDKCETWQHVICMQLPEDKVPTEYLCFRCSPRNVDSRKARDLQRQRVQRDEDNERAKQQAKRKRSGTTSHKKKESTAGLIGHISKSTNSERNSTAKAPSPRDSQAPTSRKRTQRSAPQNGSGTSHDSPVQPDRNMDADEEVEIEKYKYEFADISDGCDKYSSDKVQEFLTEATEPLRSDSPPDSRHKRYSVDDFSTLSFPKVGVRLLPNTSKLYAKSRWCLELHSSLSKGRPAALFKGEVGFQEEYVNDPINQYSFLHHPKPYVLFHPHLPIYIDARRYGCVARFVRRSCRPNVMLNTIAVDGGNVLFGYYASDTLKSGTELTVGWDWSSSKEVQHLAAEKFDFSKLSATELKVAAGWVHNLQEYIGDCACGYGTECLLDKIKKVAGFESPVKVLSNGLGGRKHRIKRNASTEPNVSKEPTPDRNGTYEEDRSSLSVVKQKSRSRELTPLTAHDTAVETGSMTGREARKFKDVLSRIEKQEQEDHQNNPTKRRKRNSSVVISNMAGSPTAESKSKGPGSKEQSPVGTPHAVEVSVADASSGRRTSDSSEGSVNRRRHQRTSNSPADSTFSPVWSKSRRKVVNPEAKSKYVDASIQTDPETDVPWWRSDQKPTPRPPRPNLRKRLMESLLRDRAVLAAATAQDKKRKHDAVEDPEPSAVSPKLPKTKEDDINRASPSPLPAKEQTATVSISVTEILSSSSSAAKIQVKSESLESPGPALGDLFADSEKARPRSQSPTKTLALGERDSPRSPGLQLQLPPPMQTSPTSSSDSVTSPMPLGNPSLFSPAVASAVGGLPTSSPTKTKKLSLKDYGKRRHKVADAGDKSDDKAKSAEPPTTPLTFLNDTRKLADILAPPAADAMNTPSTDTSSLDPKMRSARIADPLEGVR